jgi:PAS domain S-box-containing protein
VQTAQDLADLARSSLQSCDLVGAVCFDGCLQHSNPAWTTCLGWTVDELRAKRLLELVHADDRPALEAAVVKLGEGTETVAFETRSQHRDGSYRWVRWSASTQWERRLICVTGRDITQLRRLERQVLQIVDDERERLSSELHDGLCQTLAGIAALSATLARKTGADCTSGVSATAAEITELLHQAVHQARGLARGLGPPILRHTDLAGGLEILASHVEHRFGISCVFQTGFPLPALPPETEAHLFRMAQEATRNAVTHGQANHIAIKLGFTNERGHLRVLDDGVGLSDEEPLRDGIGLETMAYRARLIGAFLEVRRRARRGTEVSCVFPLTKMPASR